MNIDLNGYSAAKFSYDTEATGEISLTNTGKDTTIDGLEVTAGNVTFNLGSEISVTGQTLVNNVAVGTFNTQAVHNGTVIVSDSDGGSVNFTNSTVNAGIEIKPTEAATQPLLIRGEAPVASEDGDATVKILGEAPKVVLEGNANDVIIAAANSEFELASNGDASKITIEDTAKGSKITASKYYEFELLYTEGQTVEDITSSGLFGDKQIRVVGYPSETETIDVNYLLKLDGDTFSNVYTFENRTFTDDENVESSAQGKFYVSKDEMKVYLEGDVTVRELREYLEAQSESLFGISKDWLDGKVVTSFYDVKTEEVQLIASDTVIENKNGGMRVLVGTNAQHGLYILTQKK